MSMPPLSSATCTIAEQGVKKDKAKAIKWLEKAAIRGDVDAQELLYRVHHAKPGEFDN